MNNSYWDQFESVSDDEYFNQFEEAEKPKSKLKKAGRVAGQLALGAAERALFPYELAAQGMHSPETKTLERRQDIFEDIANLGTKKRKGTIAPEEEDELERLIQESKDPTQTLKGFSVGDNDKSFLKQSIEKGTGIDTTPEGVLENAADWYGLLKDPKKAIKSLKGLKDIRNLSKKDLIKRFTPGPEAISAISAGIGSQEGELEKLGLGTSALVFSSIAANLKGKLMPLSKELKQLHRIGKGLGLSDKEMTPILQGRNRRGFLGLFSRASERGEEAIRTSESALGELYESVKNSPNAKKRANLDQTVSFLESLEDVLSELKKSKLKGEDRTSLIKKIQDMIEDVDVNGINSEEIVETWQELGRGVNWNNIGKGDKLKQKLKDPLKKLFDQLDPENSKKFSQINDFWSRLQRTAKKVSRSENSAWAEKGEVVGAIKGLFDLATTGSTKILSTLITATGARALATEILINPRLNSLMNKTLAGIGSSSEKARVYAIKQLVDYLKTDPKLKDEADWDKLYSL